MTARARWAVFVGMISVFTGGFAADAQAEPPTAVFAAGGRKTIAVEVPTERWKGWGGGEPAPADAAAREPEKFERFETPAGQPPTFSGKVFGIPPGKAARVVVVANVGTQWIQPKNYKSANVAPDGSFTIVADHKPEAEKSLMVSVDGRLATFLRAEFAPNESARNVEFRLADARPVVLTMSDPRGKEVSAFRVEVFTPYRVSDDAGKELRMQRLHAASSAGGAIVFRAPPEPIAVLLSSNGLAPHYQVIDPREAEEFHFKMLPASRIKGVVTRDGQPLAGAEIYFVNRAAALSVTLRKTDAQGRFDVGGRVPGQQEIRIAGYSTAVQVEPGETAELNLEVGPSSPEAEAAR